jgi:hypothetical protein
VTFQEKYRQCSRWQDKVTIMNLYHGLALSHYSTWTIRQTASVFDVSIGLVSENLRLASALDAGSTVINCTTRQEALTKLERKR